MERVRVLVVQVLRLSVPGELESRYRQHPVESQNSDKTNYYPSVQLVNAAVFALLFFNAAVKNTVTK